MRSSQTTLQNVNVLLGRVDNIVGAIENQKGSVGQLIYDKALYNNLNRSVIQAEQILNEINSGKGSLSSIVEEQRSLRQAERQRRKDRSDCRGVAVRQGIHG